MSPNKHPRFRSLDVIPHIKVYILVDSLNVVEKPQANGVSVLEFPQRYSTRAKGLHHTSADDNDDSADPSSRLMNTGPAIRLRKALLRHFYMQVGTCACACACVYGPCSGKGLLQLPHSQKSC